jgi:hypothetical protein
MSTHTHANDGSKLAMMAGLGLLMGYGSYRLSKSLISRLTDHHTEDKKVASEDQKLKRLEIQNKIR